MDLPTESDSLAVDHGEETNTLDLAFSSPLPSMVEEEKEERGNAGAASGTNPAPHNFGHIDPLPPCMVFFQVHINLDLDLRGFSQVHLDQLCTPLAHLGSWPPPPLNSILVPPDFPLSELPNLILAHQKQHQPGMVMIRQPALILDGHPAPLRDAAGRVVFTGPPPLPPSHRPWLTRPTQPKQQSNFQGNKQPFQPIQQNNNQAQRPKFFPSRNHPGKPRPLRKNQGQTSHEQMNENSQNVPPVPNEMFKTTDMLQSSRVLI